MADGERSGRTGDYREGMEGLDCFRWRRRTEKSKRVGEDRAQWVGVVALQRAVVYGQDLFRKRMDGRADGRTLY